MLTIDIPGGQTLQLSHLALDFNGTIAIDGEVIAGVPERLIKLAGLLQIHVITADTHGTVAEKLAGLPCSLSIIPAEEQDMAKLHAISTLDPQRVIAIGNGRNDRLMLQGAALGIGLLGSEGACTAALLAADLLCTDIRDALDLLLQPKRLQATLRN
ncbi:MAG: hypothetical protein Q8R88_03260 [Desulfoprunum sp.]|nr:hypothetical protein [Desulfoprunum sp.]